MTHEPTIVARLYPAPRNTQRRNSDQRACAPAAGSAIRARGGARADKTVAGGARGRATRRRAADAPATRQCKRSPAPPCIPGPRPPSTRQSPPRAAPRSARARLARHGRAACGAAEGGAPGLNAFAPHKPANEHKGNNQLLHKREYPPVSRVHGLGVSREPGRRRPPSGGSAARPAADFFGYRVKPIPARQVEPPDPFRAALSSLAASCHWENTASRRSRAACRPVALPDRISARKSASAMLSSRSSLSILATKSPYRALKATPPAAGPPETRCPCSPTRGPPSRHWAGPWRRSQDAPGKGEGGASRSPSRAMRACAPRREGRGPV